MDRLIYTALTGLVARSRAQAVTANNLANAGTTGFRREITSAEGRYLSIAAEGRYLSAPAASSRAQAGAPSTATPAEPGRTNVTGRSLDIALAGESWLAIQGPVVAGIPTENYTRRGDLTITPAGVVQTGDGHAVLGQTGSPVTVPAGASLEIAPDGGLSARIGDAVTPLGRLKLVTARALEKAADNQFTSKTPLPIDPAARLLPGALEASNVQTAGALVELTEQSRSFEVNARLLGIAKEIDERTARLMSLDAQ